MAASAGLVPWNDAEVSSVTTEDIIWRLDECKDYLETATFLVYLADASLLFIQVVISSVGLYRHEPAINVKHIVDRARQATWAVKFSKKDIVLDDNGATFVGGLRARACRRPRRADGCSHAFFLSPD